MELLDTAIRAAQLAGKAILLHDPASTRGNHKTDGTPVTQADLDAHAILMRELSTYPVLSEEGDHTLSADCWVVDPLDGTHGFLDGSGEYAVMIGLLRHGVPTLGVVHVPATSTTYYASRGSGAWREAYGKRERITVAEPPETRHIRLVLSRYRGDKEEADFAQRAGMDISRAVRRSGAGLKLCAVAEGSADAYYNLDGLNIWDLCAPQIILEEAGGAVMDARGRPLHYSGGGKRFKEGIVAGSPSVVKALTSPS